MTTEEKQKAIDVLKISAPVMAVTQEEFKDYIQTLNKIMDWLEQKPCEDVISREEAIEFGNMWLEMNEDCKDTNTYTFFQMSIKALEQEQKIGRWIDAESLDGALWYACSECGETEFHATNYCPNCGAEMESEDKDAYR